jgi:hypothetical protein
MSTDDVSRATPVAFEDRMSIATPEGVEVELTLAGVGSRVIAGLIDFVIQLFVIISLLLILRPAGDAGAAIYTSASFALIFFYDVLFEVLGGGRTIGKRWAGLRVVRAGGRPITLARSALRNILRLIDILPGLLRRRHDGDLHHLTQPADRGPGGREPRRPRPARGPASHRVGPGGHRSRADRRLGRQRRIAGRPRGRARVSRAPRRASVGVTGRDRRRARHAAPPARRRGDAEPRRRALPRAAGGGEG